MKTFIAYVLGFGALILVWWLMSLVLTGIFPALISLLLGAMLGNKIVEKITGKKPKSFSFGKSKKE